MPLKTIGQDRVGCELEMQDPSVSFRARLGCPARMRDQWSHRETVAGGCVNGHSTIDAESFAGALELKRLNHPAGSGLGSCHETS